MPRSCRVFDSEKWRIANPTWYAQQPVEVRVDAAHCGAGGHHIAERKYEIGVLTEIGADKVKVAAQFGRDMQGVVGRFAPLISPRIRHIMNLAGRVWGFCTSMKDMHSLRVCLTAFDWFANIGSLH